MDANRRRVLLAVDGSKQTLDAAVYLSRLLPPARSEVVLFHVVSKIPEAFWDWEKDPLWPRKTESLRTWETRQEKKMGEFMARLRQVFVTAGFPADAVTVYFQERHEGIARDLCLESERHYDAVVAGRIGLSALDELTLGSIANKLVTKLTDVTIWLIGGTPDPRKILIALDCSETSRKAVDHVAKMVAGTEHEVTLMHVLRGIGAAQAGFEDIFPEANDRQHLLEAENAVRPLLEAARQALVAAGHDRARITSKIVSGVKSRAAAIIADARQGGYGTIVVGRRGLSGVEQFPMGRVCSKLTQLARDLALWIVA